MKLKIIRFIAIFLSMTILLQLITPSVSFALTGGPAQPEVQSFEPVGTSEMVDLFSGDMVYNIPLMDVDGYPVNISYHSGITMDQEASWVGLGWNINAGVITRNMRGVPDDFSGDMVKKEMNMKENSTYGAIVGVGGEICGWDGLSISAALGVSYNTYVGIGVEQILNVNLNVGKGGKGPLTVGLGLKSSNTDGLSISPSASFSATIQKNDQTDVSGSLSIGTSFNSRSGLKALTIGVGVSEKDKGAIKDNASDDKSMGGFNGGSSISFGTQTYVPQVSMPMKNLSMTFAGKLGGTLFSIDGTVDITGYYSNQKLDRQVDYVPAFGYMNSDEGSKLDKVMLDFNREKDGEYSENTPALPVTNFTYDVYSVAGQGVSGMYRPFRSDLGYVFDGRSNTTSESYNLGAEIKALNLVQGGLEVSATDVFTTSGKWIDGNFATTALGFTSSSNNPLYEPTYFKQAGEKTVDTDPTLFNIIGEEKAKRIALQDGGGFEVYSQPFLVSSYNADPLSISRKVRNERQSRNEVISTLTKKEIQDLNSTGVSYKYQNLSSHAEPHHMAEMSVIKSDGKRYVYGKAAYNYLQREVTFNASGLGNLGGMVTYSSGDNSINNNRADQYFSATEMPPYAHSYLLTEVLSADYVDVTGDGPSDDDLGSYTKFSYSEIPSYQWRTPVGPNKANYNEGLKTLANDDKASYVHGKKELFYLSSIETKNQIAVFYLCDRADGRGVTSENGSIGGVSTKLLEKIILNIKSSGSLIPIKTVNFEYDYSLCKGLPTNSSTGSCNGAVVDNQTGKLTLNKIFFTYGNSNKGKLSPYVFTYNSSSNPNYDMKAYDRWGNYKPNGSPTNADYPYVDQTNKSQQDQNAAAWTLKQIDLPSGGTIEINYESDDYAYVQDRQAMQMFKITGFGSNPASDNPVSKDPLTNGLNSNSVFYFKLQDPLPIGTTPSQLREKYIKGNSLIYFRALCKVNSSTVNSGYDYVSGYANLALNPCGFASTSSIPGNYEYGWIKLKSESINKGGNGVSINPISKAGLQFARLYTPQLAFGQFPNEPSGSNYSPEDVLKALVNADLINNVIKAFKTPNEELYNKHLGKDLEVDKSWFRLLNPNKRKMGGGCRVYSVMMKDRWKSMDAADDDFDYGQRYTYESTEVVGYDPTNGATIYGSSGVTSYEPSVGGDENPFRIPVYAGQSGDALLSPDNRFYQEEPFGESFFPAPTVGYSRVKVEDISGAGTVAKKRKTGSVIHEFYTAKDYPVQVERTDVDPKEKKSGLLGKLLSLDVKHYMTASQGFSIVLNDMHGKPKAKWVYGNDQVEPISGVEYFYKDNGKINNDGTRVKGNKLNNLCDVIYRDGKINKSNIGVDYDFVTDMREQKTTTESDGLQINLYTMVIFVPIVLPPIWPSYSKETTRLRTSVVTKVVNRYGILDETVTYDMGSRVSTKNLAYDAHTGEVLLTQMQNEFNDKVYSFKYPAHWSYDGMGQAYRNIGLKRVVNAASINPSTSFLVPGDEVITYNTSSFNVEDFAWVVTSSSGNLKLIDRMGVDITGSKIVKVLRSGRRNMQTVSIGSFTCLINPIDFNNNGIDPFFNHIDDSFKIINSEAKEFTGGWPTDCDCRSVESNFASSNPYIDGREGNWKLKKSYLHYTNRNQAGPSFARYDGSFVAYSPFWNEPSSASQPWYADATNWTWTSEVSKYSPYGFELENRDALNRFSAATYGYNNSLATSVSANSEYREVGVDNFEDYGFGKCIDDHFSFKKHASAVTDEAAHTGKYSIRLRERGKVVIKKYLKECSEPTPFPPDPTSN